MDSITRIMERLGQAALNALDQLIDSFCNTVTSKFSVDWPTGTPGFIKNGYNDALRGVTGFVKNTLHGLTGLLRKSLPILISAIKFSLNPAALAEEVGKIAGELWGKARDSVCQWAKDNLGSFKIFGKKYYVSDLVGIS